MLTGTDSDVLTSKLELTGILRMLWVFIPLVNHLVSSVLNNVEYPLRDGTDLDHHVKCICKQESKLKNTEEKRIKAEVYVGYRGQIFL